VVDSSTLIFIISAFALGVVMILSRERIPSRLRRGMAIASILLILFAFFLIVYSFFMAGK
jgi:threonine/homoserine/homoserine lactone efflux protein